MNKELAGLLKKAEAVSESEGKIK